MMNALALCLLLFTSLATAGFFTPSPEKHISKDDVIVKEGHAGGSVVVEFEKDDGNTKVAISPHDEAGDDKGSVADAKSKMEEAKEKIKEASSPVLPEAVMKEGDSAPQEEESSHHHRFKPREIACDAYGKCKHKIASAMGKTKEAAEEVATEAASKVYEAEEATKEAVGEAIGKVKNTVGHTAHAAYEKAHEMKESVQDTASEVTGKAKDKVAEKAGERKEEAERDVFKKMEGAKEKAKEARGTLGKVVGYMVPPVRVGSLAGVLHLLGFATAYGTGVWVTFGSSYLLAEALPRQQFAMVQSSIYPVYFKAMACGVGMALLGDLMTRRISLFSPLSMGMLQGFNLMASLGMILVNLLYLEPRATKVMLERMKKEKEEGGVKESRTSTEPGAGGPTTTTETAGAGEGTTAASEGATQEKPPAKRRIMGTSGSNLLRRLNSYSSLLNVATLMSLTWHLVHLGQRLAC